jgi:site-specific recombinase XerD
MHIRTLKENIKIYKNGLKSLSLGKQAEKNRIIFVLDDAIQKLKSNSYMLNDQKKLIKFLNKVKYIYLSKNKKKLFTKGAQNVSR